MSSFRAAAKLAQRELQIFRLKRGTKNHFVDTDWAGADATSDLTEVFDRFSRGDYNIAVRTNNLIVLDVDCHGKVDGFDALAEMPPIPETFRVRTPSGGLHIYFRAEGKAYGQRDLAKGINVRATNGYVVGPGSEVGGKLYTVESDAPIAPPPAWLIDRLSTVAEKDHGAAQVVGELDTPAALESAKAWLGSTAPVAVEYEGGNNTTYRVACAVLDRGVSPETALDLMLEVWNGRCEPPWEPEDLAQIVESAGRNRQSAIGRDNPAAGFEPATLPVFPVEPALEYVREISLDEIIAAQANAIVKGMMAPGDNGTIYGVSGGGKSFIALDMGYHIAQGRDWFGVKVKRTPVLYVALEGVSGFRKRMVAAARDLGDPGEYFARLKLSVSLANSSAGEKGAEIIVQQAKLLCARVGEDRCVVVIDTKARAAAGDDENSAADLSSYIENRVKVIATQANAFVLTVHHENKSGGIRGSTVHPAADDLILHVREGQVYAQKVKDGEEGPLFDFKLKQVKLGTDADGVAVTTCVVVKSAPTVTAEGEKRKPPKPETKAVRILREALSRVSAERRDSIVHPRTGELLPAAPVLAVKEAFNAMHGGTADHQRRDWGRAFEKAPKELKTETIAGTKVMWFEAADFAAH